jgi:hypothetical protein
MRLCGGQWTLVPVMRKASTFSSASDVESDRSCGNGEQHQQARQSGRYTDAPRYLAHQERRDADYDLEQHSKLRASSALSHASSAASATSEMAAAAPGQPAWYALAAATCSVQIAEIPPHASTDRASFSVCEGSDMPMRIGGMP